MPKISMVVPVYNVEKYLRECIESVLCQSFNDYELILIDDGSSDRSLSICKEYALKYSHVSAIHKENSGAAAARNAGIRAATGKYLMFIDSDDYLVDNCLGEIDRTIEASNADVIIGKFEVCHEKNFRNISDCNLSEQFINGKPAEEVLEYIMKKADYIYSAFRHIIKHDLIDKGGLYFYQGISYEDEEWCPRMLCTAKSFALLEKPFYCYRVRYGSVSEKISVNDSIDRIIIAESLYTYSMKLKNKIQRWFTYNRAYYSLLHSIIEYHSFNRNDRKAIYKYINSKKDLVASILSPIFPLKEDTIMIFKVLVPFSKIFSPGLIKRLINIHVKRQGKRKPVEHS